MDFLSRGHMLADVSAIIGSLDIVFGEIDRLSAAARGRLLAFAMVCAPGLAYGVTAEMTRIWSGF
jgi:hypothetical protein